MANVTGTNGNDFIHLAGDGLTVPPGYTDNPGATDGDDFITLLDGDDIAHAGLGHDTVFLDEALPYYDIFFHADTTWIDVTARFGTTDGDNELHGVEEIAFLTGTASVDVSDPGVARVRTGSGADTITLNGNLIGGVAQNWLSQDRGLFGGDFNTMTFESFGALNLNTGGGNDSVTIGIIYGLGWTPFTDSSANPQIAAPLTVDLGAGNDVLDLTNLEFSSFDPDTSLYSPLPPDPGRFHLLAGASAVQIRMGAGDDTVTTGSAAGPVTVSDNRIGSENPGINIVNGNGVTGNWIGFSGLGIAAGNSGVAIDMTTGIATSSIVGHQTTFSGMQNVEGTRGNDTVTCDNTANIIDLVAGTDHVTCGDQEAARFDMVAFSGANGGLAIDLAAGTASGGTGSGLVNATFTGAEGAFGSNFADTIDCSAANDFIFGLGGNDTTDCGDGDSDIVGFTGNFADYSIVKNPGGSFTVTDLRTPAELPVGSVSDGVDTCSDVEILRFADLLVCADAAGSADFRVNLADFATGLMPTTIVGGAGGDNTVEITLDGDVSAQVVDIEITPDAITPSAQDIIALINGIAGAAKEIRIRKVEDVEVNSTSDNSVFADIHGDFTDTDLTENTLTLNTGAGDDSLDASGVTSNHRVVMNAGGGADTLLGGAGADILNGGGANDILSGGSNNDTLNGGAGNDSMAGGDGDDIYIVAAAGDVITENAGEGADTVRSYINWTLGANLERLELLGSAANGDGNGLNNSIVGNAANNTLRGFGGDDLLDGGGGSDAMFGGTGNDIYIVAAAGDVTTENAGEGTDTVRSYINWTLANNVERLELQGSGNLNGTGNALNNTLVGNAGNNLLNGGAGNDYMVGGGGNDVFVVAAAGDNTVENAGGGTDTVRTYINWTLAANVERLELQGSGNLNGAGNTLANTLVGNSGANSLSGGDGNDYIVGGAGNDTLNGGAGNDRLIGGAGSDILNGGSGNDIFDFDAVSDSPAGPASRDSILGGFAHGFDRIDLATIDANTLAGGNQAFSFIGSAAFSGVAGQLRYTNYSGNVIIDADLNGDSLADMQILVAGTNFMTGTDFIV